MSTCIHFLINTNLTSYHIHLEAVALEVFILFIYLLSKLSKQFKLHSESWEPDLDKDEECSCCLKFDIIFHATHFPQIVIYLPALASSRALSLTPLPLLIYSPWLVFSISSFTLHSTVHPSIQQLNLTHLPHPRLHPSSASISDSLEIVRVLFWVLTHTLACAWKFKSSLALPFPFPSSHALHASSMRAVRSCFIMPKHRGWKLINGAHT